MKLSILIATITERAPQFELLKAHIEAQLPMGEAQVLSLCDNKEMSIGMKRQRLLEAATGDYVCFVDDDDWVPGDYVQELLKAIESKPDCIGFRIDCSMDGKPAKAVASLKYQEWGDNKDGFRYVRSPYHKTPIKRKLALKVGFQDMRYAEDATFSRHIFEHLHTECFIDKVMYYYRYSGKVPHDIKYGIKRAA